jgi:hypothetical protein
MGPDLALRAGRSADGRSDGDGRHFATAPTKGLAFTKKAMQPATPTR